MIYIIDYYNSRKVKSTIKKFIPLLEKILSDFGKNDFNINIVLCNNDYIQELNKKYRGKNKPTDVLSFPQFENLNDFNNDKFYKEIGLGDIIISIDKAFEQSKEYNCELDQELLRLTIHGLLHLLGMDHEISKEEENKMKEKEDYYISFFNCSL